MSLDTKFADLEIASTNNRRRLSGIHRQNVPLLTVPLDCSSSGSSVEEMDEQNNENNPVENNNMALGPTCPSVALRRSGRKRVSTTTFSSQFLSGGYTNATAKFAKLATKPTLLQLPLETLEGTGIDNCPGEYLKEIYLDKTVKLKHTALETIFEEPKAAERGKGPASIMSGRKFRRFISFDETVSNMSKKIKKRSIRAKTITSKTRNKSKFNRPT